MSALRTLSEGEKELASSLLLLVGVLKDPDAKTREVIEACSELARDAYSLGIAPGERLLATDEVCRRLEISAPTLRALRGRGDFPAPVDLVESKRLRWRESDVDAFIRRLPPLEEASS